MFKLDSPKLEGRRILVVEDEFVFAGEMATAVRRSGGEVVGPVPNVRAALALIDAGEPVDGAVLDIKLGEETSFPVAETLQKRGVAAIFVTGYDVWFIPEEQEDLPRFDKGMEPQDVVRRLLERLRKPAADGWGGFG